MVSALLVAAWIALTAMWIAAILSAARFGIPAYVTTGRSRGPTVALVALTGWIGGSFYWLVIRRQLVKATPYRRR